MKRIISITQPDDAPYQLTWIINNICTNRCSYCPPGLHAGSNHYYEWDNAKHFLKLLFQKHSKVHCSIAGGEPTVSPFFKELVKFFYESGNSVGVTSNGSRSVRFWKEVSPYLNYVCLSYHPEYGLSDLSEKLDEISNHTHTTLRVMMLSTKWDECVSIFDKFSKNPHISVEPVRILDWAGSNRSAHHYNESQLNWFSSNGFVGTKVLKFPHDSILIPKLSATIRFDDDTVDLTPNIVEYVNKGMTNFYGYRCEVGLKEMFIHYNGDIYLGNCHVGGTIGNINNPNDIKWPTTSSICNKLICHCSTDVVINKRIS